MKPKHYVFLFALLAAFASESAVNDIFPADFVSLPVGTTTAAFYGFSRNQSGPFQQGHKSMDGSLDSQTAAVRFTHVMKVLRNDVALSDLS